MALHRVLVCGGREFADKGRLFTVLDYYRQESGGFMVVIHGAARGADLLAAEWAGYRGVPVEPYPADWDGLGKSAGHVRNAQMLRAGKPTVVVAFPGGRGTADMMRKARAAKVPVLEIPA